MSILVVDLERAEVLQVLSGYAPFRGLAVTPEGRLVVAEGRRGRLLIFDPDEEGQLSLSHSLDLFGFLGDLVLSSDGRTAYVVSNTSSQIFVVDLEALTLRETWLAGTYPYDLVLDERAGRLYISNTAGDSIFILDLESGERLARIPTPKGPEGMALSEAGELIVACADDDVVLIIDTETLDRQEVDLSHHPEGLLASSPNDVALSAGRFYAVQADLNQLDVVDLSSGALMGSLPTGWYPVAVETDGERLLILNHKGLGATPEQLDPTGSLQIIPLPNEERLAELTEEVAENNSRPSRFFPQHCDQLLPLGADGKLPIEHVVLIVRENKTYDMVLGDLEGSNGDPELTLFGEEITPNLHALARRFSNLDNFHNNPENSMQGHMWVTQADCNDFVEKLRHSQLPLAGYESASMTSAPNIFEHCLNHGISFRNYGEVTSFSPEMLGRMRDFIDPKFPFFNMGVRDEDKAREVIREWELGIFPQFIFISLPNDHTYGSRPGKPTPESMVADNDRATGMLVEWLSQSPYWEKSALFIIEDDPQSWRGDHVNAHRSICIAVSPWIKQGYLSSVHYDIPSLYRTIEMLLGLPPMNKNDALANPMYDLFIDPREGAQSEPFQALALAVPHALNTLESPMARESMELDWDGIDGAEGLGQILWRIRKGAVEPPDYAKGIDR